MRSYPDEIIEEILELAELNCIQINSMTVPKSTYDFLVSLCKYNLSRITVIDTFPDAKRELVYCTTRGEVVIEKGE